MMYRPVTKDPSTEEETNDESRDDVVTPVVHLQRDDFYEQGETFWARDVRDIEPYRMDRGDEKENTRNQTHWNTGLDVYSIRDIQGREGKSTEPLLLQTFHLQRRIAEARM